MEISQFDPCTIFSSICEFALPILSCREEKLRVEEQDREFGVARLQFFASLRQQTRSYALLTAPTYSTLPTILSIGNLRLLLSSKNSHTFLTNLNLAASFNTCKRAVHYSGPLAVIRIYLAQPLASPGLEDPPASTIHHGRRGVCSPRNRLRHPIRLHPAPPFARARHQPFHLVLNHHTRQHPAALLARRYRRTRVG